MIAQFPAQGRIPADCLGRDARGILKSGTAPPVFRQGNTLKISTLSTFAHIIPQLFPFCKHRIAHELIENFFQKVIDKETYLLYTVACKLQVMSPRISDSIKLQEGLMLIFLFHKLRE